MKYRQGLHAQKAGALVASENMIVYKWNKSCAELDIPFWHMRSDRDAGK